MPEGGQERMPQACFPQLHVGGDIDVAGGKGDAGHPQDCSKRAGRGLSQGAVAGLALIEAMASNPPRLHSTRLENLSLGPQGAIFDLDGRTVRLDAQGYASPVASMDGLYRHALNDYYARSAEISRQQVAGRPSPIGRLLSWIARIFDRSMQGARVAPAPPESPAWSNSRERGSGSAQESGSPREDSRPPPVIQKERASRTRTIPEAPLTVPAAGIAPTATAATQRADGAARNPSPPVLHVIFADRDGVHVIWQLPIGKSASGPKDRDPSDPKRAPPRLELTYGLDSAMAARLQDCYGQLAQLGYKIAGLEAVQKAPEATVGDKESPQPTPEPRPASPKGAPSAAHSAVETEKSPETQQAGKEPRARKSRPDQASVRPNQAAPSPEEGDQRASLLPGI